VWRLTHVLIVEGDQHLRDLYTSALEEDGYRVTCACNYADALAQNLLHHPDVIIMDPGPGRRGLEVAHEMTRVNEQASVIFNTPDLASIRTDFSAWVADALAPKCEDLSALRNELHRLSSDKEAS
jgi:DNA-binding response OmpR family regulator